MSTRKTNVHQSPKTTEKPTKNQILPERKNIEIHKKITKELRSYNNRTD